MESEANPLRRERSRALALVVVGLIVLNIVMQVTFWWFFHNQPELMPPL